MILTIDNLDAAGTRDYTSALEPEGLPRIFRRLNQLETMECALVLEAGGLPVPASGARVILERNDGHKLFTGYLSERPQYEYLGWGPNGAVYRYQLRFSGDAWLLDRKLLPSRIPFLLAGPGTILGTLAEEIAPGVFGYSGAQDTATLPYFSASQQKKWSEHAAEAALRSRSAYRVHDGQLTVFPLGDVVHQVSETEAPDGLQIAAPDRLANDIIASGQVEPRAYVRDYFQGDGLTLVFDLSHSPFTRRTSTIFEEEYKGTSVDPLLWQVTDPASALSVSGGKLNISGGGADGSTLLQFVEEVELGGALILHHGEVEFQAASSGVIGGLYSGAAVQSDCVAGFVLAPSSSQTSITPIINGTPSGAGIVTVAGHRYALTTRIYVLEPYRRQQLFHSSVHPAGSGRGGDDVPSSVRMVLEVHDIDPASPGSLATASTILYDGVIPAAPGFCVYAPVNAGNIFATISFTRMLRAVDAEVRSTPPAGSARTRLVGTVADGAECFISPSSQLKFFSQYVPASGEAIVVSYRGKGRAAARVEDAASIAALANAGDDGRRAAVKQVLSPAARNAVDCENAAQALLDDSVNQAWSGSYRCWSDRLPGGAAADPLPGEVAHVIAPSRAADFNAVIRQVAVEVQDLAGDHSLYTLAFANDAAETLAFEFNKGVVRDDLEPVTPGAGYIAGLPDAAVTAITSTTVDVDAGADPPTGGGIEVRRSDFGWGSENDRNLVGRFTTRTFTLTRLTRVQDFYLRPFDGGAPAKYSRYSTALHTDYPY